MSHGRRRTPKYTFMNLYCSMVYSVIALLGIQAIVLTGFLWMAGLFATASRTLPMHAWLMHSQHPFQSDQAPLSGFLIHADLIHNSAVTKILKRPTEVR